MMDAVNSWRFAAGCTEHGASGACLRSLMASNFQTFQENKAPKTHATLIFLARDLISDANMHMHPTALDHFNRRGFIFAVIARAVYLSTNLHLLKACANHQFDPIGVTSFRYGNSIPQLGDQPFCYVSVYMFFEGDKAIDGF